MYRQFCRNLKNYIDINTMENESKGLRLKIAEEILPLTNIKNFLKYKDTNDDKYKELSNFIFQLSKYNESYPSLEKFIWELWAYGFDSIPYEKYEHNVDEFLEEKVKMIDLLLSSHYF